MTEPSSEPYLPRTVFVLGLPAPRRADCLSQRASLTGMYLIVVHLIGVHLGVHLVGVLVIGYQLHRCQH